MKINLLKARKLDKAISVILNSDIDIIHKVSKYVESDAFDLVFSMNLDSTNETISKMILLIELKSNIRSSIDKQNHECGITELLEDKTKIKNFINFLNRIESLGSILYDKGFNDLKIIKKKIESMLEQSNDHYGHDLLEYSSISTKVLKNIQSDIIRYKNEVLMIEDKLIELNASNHIELSDYDIDIIKSFDSLKNFINIR